MIVTLYCGALIGKIVGAAAMQTGTQAVVRNAALRLVCFWPHERRAFANAHLGQFVATHSDAAWLRPSDLSYCPDDHAVRPTGVISFWFP